MKFTVPDLKLFKKMVSYSNSDDEKELSKDLHKKQPHFCNLIDPVSNDSRCFEVHRYCTLFCAIASEYAELIIERGYDDYIKIPGEYFDTMAHLIAQKKPIIGKRGLAYPDRIKKNILRNLDFDDGDNEWLLIMIPAFLYTIENYYSKENPKHYFIDLYHEL